MKHASWIFKLNILVIALILVIFLMSQTQSGSLQKFLAGILSATPQSQEQKAER